MTNEYTIKYGLSFVVDSRVYLIILAIIITGLELA